MARKEVKTSWDRENRANIDENFKELYNQYTGAGMNAEEAKSKAIDALDKSAQALSKSEQTQTELDRAILKGDSSPLSGQLSVGAGNKVYSSPQERLLKENEALTSQLAERPTQDEVRENTDIRPINVSELDTETKKLFTGGSVAVVGENAVGKENIKSKAVTTDKTTFLKSVIGKNKINPNNIVTNFYYSAGSTAIKTRTGGTVLGLTGLIPVTEGQTYTFSGTASRPSGGYFGQSAVVADGQGSISVVTFSNMSFTVPTGQGIKYVALNLLLDSTFQTVDGTYQLELGSEATPIEIYTEKNELINPHFGDDVIENQIVKKINVNTQMVVDKAITPEKMTIMETVPKKNLINPEKVDKYLYYSPGSKTIVPITSGTTFASSGLIEVNEGEWYVFSGDASSNFGGYFGSGAKHQNGQTSISNIEFVTPVDGVGVAFQVPLKQGIKYVLLDIRKDPNTLEILGSYQLEKGEQATEIEEYKLLQVIKEEHLPMTTQQPSVSTNLDNESWFNFLEGVSYGNESDKISNFRKHWISKDKDLVVAMTGTSLTARSTEHSTDHKDANKRPPLFHSNNFASLAWDKIKWEGQEYRRYDSGFFVESGTFQTQSNITDWDDGPYRHGLTRYADAGGSISFKVPVNAWQFNFIYRSDIKGSENCVINIAEGNGKMEVWNGSAWVEANGYHFSQRETIKNLSNITVYNPLDATNPKNQNIATYQIGGNTTYQKRLKMRCKSGAIDSRSTEKNVTISATTGRLLYWGVEWSVREFMITFINASRGSHNITAGDARALQKFQDNELWSFKPDLIFSENPIHNSGGSGASFSTYPSNYWGNITNNFFFNTDNPISLTARATANGINNLEWIIFNSSIAWNFGGIDDNGELIIAADKDGRMITALDAQMLTHEWIKANNQEVISLNAVKYWVDSGRKIFGNLKAATVGSGKSGRTFTNEGSHWNDTGSRVMAKCILPIFDFIV